jgi:hypothetical protein
MHSYCNSATMTDVKAFLASSSCDSVWPAALFAFLIQPLHDTSIENWDVREVDTRLQIINTRYLDASDIVIWNNLAKSIATFKEHYSLLFKPNQCTVLRGVSVEELAPLFLLPHDPHTWTTSEVSVRLCLLFLTPNRKD